MFALPRSGALHSELLQHTLNTKILKNLGYTVFLSYLAAIRKGVFQETTHSTYLRIVSNSIQDFFTRKENHS